MPNNSVEKSENVTPSSSAAEVRASSDWCTRISGFQTVHIGYANTRPALTTVVQDFLSMYDTAWCKLIVANGGIDGYFGTATQQCVEDYQSQKGLSVDGIVGPDTWYQIGADLTESESPDGTYRFFWCNGGQILRALDSSPYTFYYPISDSGDLRWYVIPQY